MKSFPLVKQYNVTDCGPASLLSVLRHYGGDSSLPRMRELCQTDKEGSTLFHLKQGAEKCGFAARAVSGTLQDLEKEKLPCIAHGILNNTLNHFVVVLKIGEKWIKVADPGRGKLKMRRAEFLDFWQKGIVLLLQPSAELLQEEHGRSLTKIRSFILAHRNHLIQSIFLGIVISLSGVVGALTLQVIIDSVIPGKNISALILTVSAMFFIMIMKALAASLRIRMLALFNYRFNRQLQQDSVRHLLRLPQLFFDRHKTGDISSRMNDALRIQKGIVQISNDLLIHSIILLSAFAYIAFIDIRLAAALFLITGLYIFIALRMLPSIRDNSNRVMKSHAEVDSNYVDMVRGQEDIKINNADAYFARKNETLFKVNRQEQKSLQFKIANYILSLESVSALITAFFLVYGVSAVIRSEMPLGELMGSYSLLGNMLPSLQSIMTVLTELQGSRAAVTRLSDILEYPEENRPDAKPEKTEQLEVIELKNAAFAYPGFPPLFEEMNLRVCRGKQIKIRGRNGSGKTSFAKVLSGLYDLSKGTLMFNNKPYETFRHENQRDLITTVPQFIYIFNGSLIENLLIGNSDSNPEKLDELVAQYGLHWFIRRFKQGYLTDISEDGRRLSGGERFVVGLIRALLSEPDLLVVDESLAALDWESRKRIDSLLAAYAEKHILITISHQQENPAENVQTLYLERKENFESAG